MVSYEDALAAILEVWIKCYERFEQQVPAFVVCLCIQGGNANPHFGYVGRPLALLGLVKTLRGGAYTHEGWREGCAPARRMREADTCGRPRARALTRDCDGNLGPFRRHSVFHR
jgi:hypothetical protein